MHDRKPTWIFSSFSSSKVCDKQIYYFDVRDGKCTTWRALHNMTHSPIYFFSVLKWILLNIHTQRKIHHICKSVFFNWIKTHQLNVWLKFKAFFFFFFCFLFTESWPNLIYQLYQDSQSSVSFSLKEELLSVMHQQQHIHLNNATVTLGKAVVRDHDMNKIISNVWNKFGISLPLKWLLHRQELCLQLVAVSIFKVTGVKTLIKRP